MNRESFWQLVELLTQAGGAKYWHQPEAGDAAPGRPSRPIYYQVAVGLYVLGGGTTMSKSRVTMNVSQGSTWKYAWRTITLLARLLGEYVRWPAKGTTRYGDHDVFRRCIGFLDGSNIILRDRPLNDPEAYFSRKKNYGFNLQAICDWNGKFIWVYMGHTASAHDSTAFKSTDLYRTLNSYFDPEEYILADKAYALERHIITPFKEPASRQADNAAFNKQFSKARVKIEHAFGVLKARWPTLRDIPVRIGEDRERGHKRVLNWTIACVVLHNFLQQTNDDNEWLQNEGVAEEEPENGGQERYAEIQRAGMQRRDELRDLSVEL